MEEINHPSARECLRKLELEHVEVHYDGDLPGQSGLGSSSAFTVAMLHALHALKAKMISKQQLAEQAIEIEQKMLGENVGCQDQVAAAFGGMNVIQFDEQGFHVAPVYLRASIVEDLEAHMSIFFVGKPRNASAIAAGYITAAATQEQILQRMLCMVDQGTELLDAGDMKSFGELLHESWILKRRLSADISSTEIDEIYLKAVKAGAWGGKLLGAGSGGFLLVFRSPDKALSVSLALAPNLEVKVKLENQGSQIIHYS